MPDVQTALVDNANGKLSRAAMYRAVLDHTGWHGGGRGGVAWLASRRVTREELAASLRDDLIGDIAAIEHLDDHVTALSDSTMMLKLEIQGPIAVVMDNQEIPAFKRFARGHRVERAIAEHDYARIVAHDSFFLAIFGELGTNHQVIVLPTERGAMVAAFTALDEVERFLAMGSAENRASVRLVSVTGRELFSDPGKVADGIILNLFGPRPTGFDLDACRQILAAG